MLVLPLGLMYGRVLPSAASEFVAAAEAGEVVGALPRSRDISLVSTTPVDRGTVLVRIARPRGLSTSP